MIIAIAIMQDLTPPTITVDGTSATETVITVSLTLDEASNY